jgi:hypothetical protein
MITDLLGRKVRAVPKQGWVSDGGEPVECVGEIRAIAIDRGFVLILEEDGGRLCLVMTLTHEILMAKS